MTNTNTYLENQILTATPQKLRLMLIEGAIRFAGAARQHWADGENEAAETAILRAMAVTGELVRSVRAEPSDCERVVDHIRRDEKLTPEGREVEIQRSIAIGRDTTAVYLVVLRDLNEILLAADAGRIENVLRVLEVERETAQLVCQELPTAPILDLPAEEEIVSSQAADILGENDAASGHSTYGSTPNTARSNVFFDA